MVVVALVPVFPGRGRRSAGRAAVFGGERGRSGEHARDVWERERGLLVRTASGLERKGGGGRGALVALVPFEFLGALARHAEDCPISGCADWLAWGIGQVLGLRELWRALGGEWQSVPPGYARALAAVWRA